ncbi:acyl-CoA dehydrogenase family protein [Carnimonas bestiolae]|uniref:acyl-CoA dehydrogenase family protein n=1 Tax=Carnimonas bestiolae TaxID=3402172 RepID=UPI003EDB7C80
MSTSNSESIAFATERPLQQQLEVEEEALATARALSEKFASILDSQPEQRQVLPWAQLAELKESGLTTAVIPPSRGGLGLRWPAIGKVVREIAAGDGSVGAVLGYHLMQLFHLRREPLERWHALEQRIAEQRLWLAGVVNPRDDDVVASREGDHWVLNGRKNFCTGNGFADLLTLSVTREEDGASGAVLIPADREGVTRLHNWEAIGLERSESGSVVLDNVEISAEELVLDSDSPGGNFAAAVKGPVNQSLFVNFYTGYTQGAIFATKRFVHEYARAWLRSSADTASDDILNRARFGEMWVEFQASVALADSALEKVQTLLAAGESFSRAQRGEAAAAVATAKAHVARKGLTICSEAFELMSARATASRYGLDRYWRDLRTHSLHDPVVYKFVEVGDFALNDQYAEVGAYQ